MARNGGTGQTGPSRRISPVVNVRCRISIRSARANARFLEGVHLVAGLHNLAYAY